MRIRARMSTSIDGYVTTPSGWPSLTADAAFVSGQSHGIREFLEGCEAALMGRTTFEPALSNERWPWPNLDVFVLSSERPAGTPDHVVSDSDPAILLEKLRAANRGGDVHLVGGPRTIETFRSLGALETAVVVRELVQRLADVTERIRGRMDRLGELDLASQDVVIEVVRELEKQLWMVRSQLAPERH